MKWTFVNILMLFGAIQGLVIVLILFLKKEDNKKARLYLSLILFGLSMNLLYYFSHLVGLLNVVLDTQLLNLPWSLLCAISFYLYIVFISPLNKKLTRINKLGFLPFVFFSIIIVAINCYNYFSPLEQRINLNSIRLLFYFVEYFGIIFSLFMGFLSYNKLKEIEIQVQEQFSNYNKSKLQFHKLLTFVTFLFCVIWVIITIYDQISITKTLPIYYIIWLFITFVIHWISWTGFINDDALLPVFKNNVTYNVLKKEEISQKNNCLNFDKNNKHYKALILLFDEEQLFLEPDLSLETLSNKLGISRSYLSALINQTTNKNFYYFVNSYRIEHIIYLFKAQKNKEFTILSLAYESGFKSKSTFQAFFKKNKGKTPTQFLKELEVKNKSE